MKRTEVLESHDTDAHGRITSPGQFEGEMVYLPHFWSIYLNGCADRDNGQLLGFDIKPEDCQEFPELGKHRRTVRIHQRDDGFICEV